MSSSRTSRSSTSADGLLDLEPHRRAEPAAHQLPLQCLEQVLGVVLVDLQVLVPGDPERVVSITSRPANSSAQVRGDHVLDRHEPLAATAGTGAAAAEP